MNKTLLLRLLQNWDLGEVFEIVPLQGGINAETWRLETARGTFAAKFAFDETAFEGGVEIAEQLEFAGFSAGRPVRRRDGSMVLFSPQGALAVTAFVPGSPLDVSNTNGMRIWGSTMALLHRTLLRLPRIPGGVRRWPWRWLDPEADHVTSRPWLRATLRSALSQAERVVTNGNLTLGLIHGDGAPVMLESESQRVSVIDWGAAMWGPLLYDVATAYWFSVIEHGLDPSIFHSFMKAYRETAATKADDWRSLDAFVYLRGVIHGFTLPGDATMTSRPCRVLETMRGIWQTLETKLSILSGGCKLSGDPAANLKVYFECDDVDELYIRLHKSGVQFDHPPQKNSWGYGPQLKDPNEYVLRFFDRRSVTT